MNRYKYLLAVIATLIFGTQLQAQTVLGPGVGTGRTQFFQNYNRTLYRDTVYTLTGLYFVEPTFNLTIQPGTVILGDTVACLIIRPGATITANGTPNAPIVFTSMKPAGQRRHGDWGGVVILGNAPVNQSPLPQIEGGIIPGQYGGIDPNDNSGIFRYVRIEFPGYRFQLNNEINGLTMGGVGRGTQIDHIQVSYSDDDSYEWFGGTVDAKYLVAFGGTDDEFDTDFGYQGRVQFAFGLRDPYNWDPTGQSNGFESDNMGTASYVTPRTFAQFSNITLVGNKRVDTVAAVSGNSFQYGMLLRRGTEFSVYNSIIMGYPGGLALRDAATINAAYGDTLKIRSTSLAAWDGATFATMTTASTTPAPFSVPTESWFTSRGNTGGAVARNASAIGLVNMNFLNNPDPRPAPGSEPTTAGVWFDTLNTQNGNYFDVTTYRGAFDPSVPLNQLWTAGWTNYDPQNVIYTSVSTSHSANQWNLRSVPVVPSSYLSSVLFPGTVGNPFSFKANSYAASSTLENGDGYWIYYNTTGSNAILGAQLNSTSVTLNVPAAGRWAMIGSASSVKPVANVVVSGPATIVGSLFGWSGSAYTAATQIVPGQAYWVYLQAVGAGGSVTLTVNP
jgi:hypothetical protein